MSAVLQVIQKYRNSKIALYGLGAETEKVIQELGNKVEVVGLLDGCQKDGWLYGKPILSMQQAIDCCVKLILVVARPGSCKAIAKRIGKICKEKQIQLMDIRGNDLCEEKKIAYGFENVRGYTKSQLWEIALEYDVISIDLFDTLVMRQTLFPTDVFEIAYNKLKEKGIHIENFCEKRLGSEKFLSKTTAPTLTDIYSQIEDFTVSREMTPEKMADLEWSVDYELILPRQEICEMISQLYRRGKKIYIVSDTYYTEAQIEKILKKCNIDFYTECILSCHYHTGKCQELYQVLKGKIGGERCIHIGDDIKADVESAAKNGLASYQIYSAAELLEAAGYLGLWDSINNLSDRIRVGMFIARLLNSPFQFEAEGKRICIDKTFDIGYLLFAPIINDFVLWFDTQVKAAGLQNVWFTARDGYLIKKMYDELNGDTSTSVYFLTSRIAAVRAGIESEEDIEDVEKMKFSGTLQEQLKERFGIMESNEKIGQTLLDHKARIIAKASECRKNYKTYITGLGIKEGGAAFFDFVAKGTIQMYISRLVENHLRGFYFMQLEEETMREKGVDVQSFYRKEEKDNSAVFDNYYILETILTSPDPSIQGFDDQGTVCYAQETRKREDIQCIMSVQRGIYDYFKSYLKICPCNVRKINKELDETMLSLIHEIVILNKDFLGLRVEDPFFNRMTDIVDLI